MVGPSQLDLQQSRRLSPQLLLCRDVSSTHRHPIYMDRLQDYFSSYCEFPYPLPFLLPSPVTPCFIDGLCLCDGTCTIIIQPTPMLDMDLVSSTLMQCIQPSAQPVKKTKSIVPGALPAGRITESQAIALRWAIVVLCLLWSSIYDQDLVLTTIGLVATTFMYDELGAASHIIGKNFCNIGGYASFEIGATTIIGLSLLELPRIADADGD